MAVPDADAIVAHHALVPGIPPVEAALTPPLLADLILVFAHDGFEQANVVDPVGEAGDDVFAAGGDDVAVLVFVPYGVAGDGNAAFFAFFRLGYPEDEGRIAGVALVVAIALFAFAAQRHPIGAAGLQGRGGDGEGLLVGNGLALALHGQIPQVLFVVAPIVQRLDPQLIAPDVFTLADGDKQVLAPPDAAVVIQVNKIKSRQVDRCALFDRDGHGVAVGEPIAVVAPLVVVPFLPVVIAEFIIGDAGGDALVAGTAQAVGPGPGGIILLPVPFGPAPLAVPEQLHRRDALGNGHGDVHILVDIHAEPFFAGFMSLTVGNLEAYLALFAVHHQEALANLADGIVPVIGPGDHLIFVANLRPVLIPADFVLVNAVKATLIVVLIGIDPDVVGPDLPVAFAAVAQLQVVVHVPGGIALGDIPSPIQHWQLDVQILARPKGILQGLFGGGHVQLELRQKLVGGDAHGHILVRAGPEPGVVVLVVGAHAQIIGALLHAVRGVVEHDAVAAGLVAPLAILIDAHAVRFGGIGVNRILVMGLDIARRGHVENQFIAVLHRDRMGIAVIVSGIAVGPPPDIQAVIVRGNSCSGDGQTLEIVVEFAGEHAVAFAVHHVRAQPQIGILHLGDVAYRHVQQAAAGNASIVQGDIRAAQGLPAFVDVHLDPAGIAGDPHLFAGIPVLKPGPGIDHRGRLILPELVVLHFILQLVAGPLPDEVGAIVQPGPFGLVDATGPDRKAHVVVGAGIVIIHVDGDAEAGIGLGDDKLAAHLQGVIALQGGGDGHAIDLAGLQVLGGQHEIAVPGRQTGSVDWPVVVIGADHAEGVLRPRAFVAGEMRRSVPDIQLVAGFHVAVHIQLEIHQRGCLLVRQGDAAEEACAQQGQGRQQPQQLPVFMLHSHNHPSLIDYSLRLFMDSVHNTSHPRSTNLNCINTFEPYKSILHSLDSKGICLAADHIQADWQVEESNCLLSESEGVPLCVPGSRRD